MYAKNFAPLSFVVRLMIGELFSTRVQAENFGSTYVAALPDGYVPFPKVHAAYKVYNEPSSWVEAYNSCVDYDRAYLAIVDSATKISMIDDLRGSSDKWLHVGIYWSENQKAWIRVDNDLPASPLLWAEDGPHGTNGCVGMTPADDGAEEYGFLMNYPCDKPGEYFVCEIPI